MAQQIINVGAAPNDGQGDPLRTAFIKSNNNFSELYSRAQTTPPPTLIGSVGDEAGMYAYDSSYFYYCYANYDGSSTIWAQVTQVGNVSLTQLTNGTSNVIADLNGNIRMGIANVANSVQFTPLGQQLTGNLSATGNVTGTFIIGDGSLLTNLPIPGVYGNTEVAAFLPTYTGNLASLTGPVSTTGNVIGNYIIGDGSLLTNVNASNVSVAKIANGFSQVNIPVVNSNVLVDVGVVSNLAVFSAGGLSVAGNIDTNDISVTANISAVDTISAAAVTAATLTGTLATGTQTGITSVGTLSTLTVTSDVTGGAFLTGGYVSAVGNITGSYIYGNGAFLTGITGGSGGNGTAIVNGLTKVEIPTNSGNVAVTVGFSPNVAIFTNSGLEVTGTIAGNDITTAGTVSATGNITGGNIHTAGLISVAGNVTANYIIGDGSLLTNVGAGSSYGNANVAAYLPTYTGNLSAGNLSVSGQANVTGNVNVNYQSRINGTVDGQLYGLVNGVNTAYGTWDFGFIAANTYNNPIQWIFAQTSAGNIDMGNITAPASLNIDIGTIF